MYFRYKALKGTKTVENKIEAASSAAVVDYLQKNGYFPVWVKEVKEETSSFLSSFTDKVGFNDVVDFTRQVAIMLNAGLTLIDALEILKKQITKVSMNRMIEEIDKHIKSGEPFSTALKKY